MQTQVHGAVSGEGHVLGRARTLQRNTRDTSASKAGSANLHNVRQKRAHPMMALLVPLLTSAWNLAIFSSDTAAIVTGAATAWPERTPACAETKGGQCRNRRTRDAVLPAEYTGHPLGGGPSSSFVLPRALSRRTIPLHPSLRRKYCDCNRKRDRLDR